MGRSRHSNSSRHTDIGFHDGERAVQDRAGVAAAAARLSPMLEPAELGGSVAAFLRGQTFAAITGRDHGGQLWVSPLTGPPGFLRVESPTRLRVGRCGPAGDPLHGLPAGQRVGMVVVDFAARRRVRLNGILLDVAADHLAIEVEQAFGNCPQYIQQRTLVSAPAGSVPASAARASATLSAANRELIRHADTFFLGTTNPARGSDASHRGGSPGFVRASGNEIWWPDYPGNNIFNSLGNLEVTPEAALLFPNFATGAMLQLTGTAAVEWTRPGAPGDDGGTGRRVVVQVGGLVAAHLPGTTQVAVMPYARNPAVTG
jgi:uncharacterized protein